MISPYFGSGRYFPVYWLYQDALVFGLFSTNTAGHYVVQSVLFLFSALLASRMFLVVTGPGLVAVLFGVAIFLSTPNAETLYTLFKAEPLVLFFTTVALLLFYFRARRPSSRSLPRLLAIALLFTLSIWSKETSLALIVFALAGCGLAFVFSRSPLLAPYVREDLRSYLLMLLALSGGFALSRLPYWIYASDASHLKATYTTFSVTPDLIWKNIYFYFSQQPDVIGFGILGSVFLVMLFRRAFLSGKHVCQKSVSDFIFAASLLAMASSYGAIFIVWRWPMAYYLFVPALLCRFVAGFGFYHLVQWHLIGRRGFVISSVVATALLGYAAVYVWYTGASQVAYSQMYSRALRAYASFSHQGDSLVIESYPFYAEQAGGTSQVLETAFHASRRLYGIGDLVNPALVTREMRELLSVTDEDLAANEKNWPKKDDYVIAFTGSELGRWQIRGISPYYSDGSDLQRDGGYDMDLVNEDSVYFPALFPNVWTHRPNLKSVYSGYKIYRVREGPRFTWLGRYPDGWMGRRARLTLYPYYVTRALVHISTSTYNPVNPVTVLEGGRLIKSETLREGEERTFELTPRAGDQPTVFEIRVTNTFIPDKLGLNEDIRELGALIRLEPFGTRSKGGTP